MASDIIKVVRTLDDTQAPIRRLNEAITQTFLRGTPVALDASGNVIAWAGVIVTGAVGSIIGITFEDGASLAVVGTPKTLTFGSVPYMSSAVNIPRGAPPNDARNGLFLAAPTLTVFRGQINPSGQSLLATDIGVHYGLTKDSDNHWYIDKAKTTDGVNTCVTIVERDALENGLTDATRRSCYFQFIAAYVQLLA